jgi:hypothetical protein
MGGLAALLAQGLVSLAILSAWAKPQQQGRAHKPGQWAQTWPTFWPSRAQQQQAVNSPVAQCLVKPLANFFRSAAQSLVQWAALAVVVVQVLVHQQQGQT